MPWVRADLRDWGCGYMKDTAESGLDIDNNISWRAGASHPLALAAAAAAAVAAAGLSLMSLYTVADSYRRRAITAALSA